MSGLSRVRTELLQLAVVPTLPPHPVQMHRQLPRHRYLGNLASAPHRKVEESTAPLRLISYRDLRRFYQQKSKQRVTLFANVPQSPPIATGLLRRHQSHIAGDLFATMKTLGSSDHQLEPERRQRSNSGMRHQPPRDRAFLDFRLQSTS